MPKAKRRRARRAEQLDAKKSAKAFDVLALREKLGGASGKAISRAAMAKLLGVSPGSIYNWEKASNTPTAKAVAALKALSDRFDRGEVKIAGDVRAGRKQRGHESMAGRRALTRNGSNGANGLEGPTFYANDVRVSRGASEGCLRFRVKLEGASVAVCNVFLPLPAFDALRSGSSEDAG